MNDENLKNNDSALFSYYILRKLGCGKIDTFDNRLRSQKVYYFAQLFDVAPKYQYNLYLRGPYSPTLANILYQLSEKNISIDESDFVPTELKDRFIKLKKFISDKSNRELELLATSHWLVKVVGFKIDDAKNKLVELKNATNQEIEYIFKNFIKKYDPI